MEDESPTLGPQQPLTVLDAYLDTVFFHLPNGAVERGAGEIHPDDVVDLQIALDRPVPHVRALLAEVADHIAPLDRHRGARTDRFDEAPGTWVSGVRSY
ncbi:hypothetical protein F750_6949 [Streptomyces sp. PAMC 26508]|nr:hypothetical protein F750_6949 [Streptomyces sp. PAMC 26508]